MDNGDGIAVGWLGHPILEIEKSYAYIDLCDYTRYVGVVVLD